MMNSNDSITEMKATQPEAVAAGETSDEEELTSSDSFKIKNALSTPNSKKYAKLALAALAITALAVGLGVGLSSQNSANNKSNVSSKAKINDGLASSNQENLLNDICGKSGKSGKSEYDFSSSKSGKSKYEFEPTGRRRCRDMNSKTGKGDFYDRVVFRNSFGGSVEDCQILCSHLATPAFRGIEVVDSARGDRCRCLFDEDHVPPCPRVFPEEFGQCRQVLDEDGDGPIEEGIEESECYVATLAGSSKSAKSGVPSTSAKSGSKSGKSKSGKGKKTFREIGGGLCRDNTGRSYSYLRFRGFAGTADQCQSKCAAIGGHDLVGVNYSDSDSPKRFEGCYCLYEFTFVPECPIDSDSSSSSNDQDFVDDSTCTQSIGDGPRGGSGPIAGSGGSRRQRNNLDCYAVDPINSAPTACRDSVDSSQVIEPAIEQNESPAPTVFFPTPAPFAEEIVTTPEPTEEGSAGSTPTVQTEATAPPTKAGRDEPRA